MDVRANLISAAAEFAALGLDVVFTGGSSISEYLDAEMPESVRPTLDVDVVVNIANRREFYEFMARLDEAMWGHPQMEGDAPIGRRRTPGGILVDVIPVSDVALGFTNRWYAEGLNRTWTRDGTVRLFPVDILIASKLEAFASRGRGDWYGSHDIEDVVTVIEGRSTIVADLSAAPATVAEALSSWLITLQSLRNFEDIVAGHLTRGLVSAGRDREVTDRIRAIVRELRTRV